MILLPRPVGITTTTSFLLSIADIASSCPGLNLEYPKTFLRTVCGSCLLLLYWYPDGVVDRCSGCSVNL
jgi:hypothetical protein